MPMNTPHIPNPNPAVETLMQAYLKTHMTERQFEALVEKTLLDARNEGGSNSAQEDYDEGFSAGYDTAMAEK